MTSSGFTEFTDVLTFDGAYSLFPAQYDEPIGDPVALSEPPQPCLKPVYRGYSDRSSWVVTFDKTNVVPPQLVFGTSTLVRDPLYTSSSILVWSSQTDGPKCHRTVIQLRGVVLRSGLLRLAHVMCCPKLSQFVQQFLTRLVLAYPERANSWYAICPPSRNCRLLISSCAERLCSFDAEVAQFLQIVFERADIRDGLASYSTVWEIMKVCIPSSRDLRWNLHKRVVELTRNWSLYRPILQVQVCSGHTGPFERMSFHRASIGC